MQFHHIIDFYVLEQGEDAVREVLSPQSLVVLLVHVHVLHQVSVLLLCAKHKSPTLQKRFDEVWSTFETLLSAVEEMLCWLPQRRQKLPAVHFATATVYQKTSVVAILQ